MNPNIYIQKIIEKENLSQEEAYTFIDGVMKGNISEILLSSFLTALKMKGETIDEITGFVRAVRDASYKINHINSHDFLDTCGTGGDGKNSINVSTLTAITLGSLGLKVSKHGNRSVSSLCGSSDFLDEFGYVYTGDHEKIAERILRHNFTFLFAPHWHPAMKFAAPVRKELGFRTVFNLIGPLSNPLSPSYQLVGVYNKNLLEVYASVLKNLNCKKAIICHSNDGFDEFSIFQTTHYVLLDNGSIIKHEFNPDILKLENLNPSEVFATNKSESVRLSEKILQGENSTGALKVALNVGVGLFLMGKENSIESGFFTAHSHLTSGKVHSYFKMLISDSRT